MSLFKLPNPNPIEPDSVDVSGVHRLQHEFSCDDKTLLAIMSALMFVPADTPLSVVDRASAILREVKSR